MTILPQLLIDSSAIVYSLLFIDLSGKIQFEYLVFLVLFILATLTSILYIRLRINHSVEKQNLIRIERKRIASDLHDELGSGLSAINLLAKYLEKQTGNNILEYKNEIAKISETSANLNQSFRDIIWSIEQKDEHLQELFQYINKYYQGIFEKTGIEFHFEFTSDFEHIKLAGESKRHLLMCIKECINNCIKHANASELKIEGKTIESNKMMIKIKDNGQGFKINNTANNSHLGNGLQNIKSRMLQIGGKINIESNKSGTSVTLELPTN